LHFSASAKSLSNRREEEVPYWQPKDFPSRATWPKDLPSRATGSHFSGSAKSHGSEDFSAPNKVTLSSSLLLSSLAIYCSQA
jgi:hypothetical protein